MSASIMEIGRLTNGSKVPISDYEEPFGSIDNHIIIPFNVLWEEARNGITNLVHFSFKNLHQILGQAEVDVTHYEDSSSDSRSLMSINSRVISASFGRGRAGHQIQFPNTVSIELKHLTGVSESEELICVAWDYHLSSWSNSGCSLLSQDSVSATCSCDRMTAFATMLTPAGDQGLESNVPIMTLQIVTYIVAAISVLCVVLILVKVGTISQAARLA